MEFPSSVLLSEFRSSLVGVQGPGHHSLPRLYVPPGESRSREDVGCDLSIRESLLLVSFEALSLHFYSRFYFSISLSRSSVLLGCRQDVKS